MTATKTRPRHRRRSTVPDMHDVPLLSCHSLPHTLEALDPSSGSATQSLAALRILLLSYLEDVENRLSTIDSPISEVSIPTALKIRGEHTVEDAHTWARDALEMLRSIRSDVCSYLPELPDVPSLSNVRAQFSNSLPDPSSVMEDVRSRFSDKHISVLSARFQSLQTHLRSTDVLTTDLHTFPGNTRLSALFESIMSSDLVTELSDDVTEVEDMARDVARAIKQSLQGSKLIHYVDLPPQWRSNRFVTRGYRYVFGYMHVPRVFFMPTALGSFRLRSGHLSSCLCLHGTTKHVRSLSLPSLHPAHTHLVNIHTHLVPFILWSINCIPIFNSSSLQDTPEAAFITFALVCLFNSVLWHTMAGCAHHDGMDLCARIDYVGIGW